MSYAKAMDRTPQSEPLDCLQTSIILITSLVADVNKRLVMTLTVVEDTEGYMLSYTLITPSSQPALEIVHQWLPQTQII